MRPDTDTTDDGGSELEVEAVDVDDIVRQERIRAIFEAKQECREVRHKAETAAAEDAAATRPAATHFRHAVESFARETETLFSRTRRGREYWTGYDFGTVVLQPDTYVKDTPRGTKQYLPRPGDTEDRVVSGDLPVERLNISGLNSLFETESPIVREMEVMVAGYGRWDGSSGSDVCTVTTRDQIDFRILDQMYATINAYLSHIGLGVEVEADDANTWEV
jgi:hypothetical protein